MAGSGIGASSARVTAADTMTDLLPYRVAPDSKSRGGEAGVCARMEVPG